MSMIKANGRPFCDAISEILVNVREIRRSPNLFWKSFWILVGLTLIVAFSHNLFDVSKDYFNYGYNTNLRDEIKDEMEFPRITICLKRWFNFSKFYQDYPENRTWPWIEAYFQTFQGNYKTIDYKVFKRHYETIFKGKFDPRVFIEKFALKCEVSFARCASGMGHEISCCDAVKARFYHGSRICYQLEFPYKQKSTDGIADMLLVGIRNIPPNNNGQCSLDKTFKQKECQVDVYLTSPEEDQSISNVNSFFTTDNLTIVNMHQRVVQKLPPPYGVCGEKDLEYFSGYSRSLCRVEAEANRSLELCGCMPLGLLMHRHNIIKGHPICDPIQMAQCVNPLRQNLTSYCPQTCIEYHYDMDRSSSKSQISGSFEDSLVLGFFYDMLSVTHIEDKAKMSITDYWSKIGAILSLWLGMRAMSFLQIFYYGHWLLRRIYSSGRSVDVIELESGVKK